MKKKILLFVIIPLLGLILLIITNMKLNIINIYYPRCRVGNSEILWEDKGPTPGEGEKYTPQGMTWINGKIIIANSLNNTKSCVFEIDPETMKILRHFEMPDEAVHTSGLAWDGYYLWGVDYISNRAYCIDSEESFKNAQVRIIGSFDTTLKGTSACCIVNWEGRQYLAISDFMRTKCTLFINMYEALKKGSAQDMIVFKYKNEGFSQGLEFFDGFLYEAESKLGIDRINKIDIEKLRTTKNARKSTIFHYLAPSKSVEDLAWSGSELWTSDEYEYKIFKGVIK